MQVLKFQLIFSKIINIIDYINKLRNIHILTCVLIKIKEIVQIYLELKPFCQNLLKLQHQVHNKKKL